MLLVYECILSDDPILFRYPINDKTIIITKKDTPKGVFH